jgi:hypothetical protein
MVRRFERIGFVRMGCRKRLAKRLQTSWLMAVNLLVFLEALMILTAPAFAAGPRDEVIAGMFRCAAVGDTRAWLDCFYGAAQPVRAALGLPSVLPAQARLAQNPPASPQSGDPGPRYQTTSEVLRCNSLSEDRQWLDCYYAAAQPVRTQLGLLPAPQVRPTLPADAAVKPTVSQGAGSVAVRFPISSRMASYSFDRYGVFTVVLANGQTWRQLSGDTSAAHWTKPAPGYTVQISRGALRSFNLKVKGISSAYKVERID